VRWRWFQIERDGDYKSEREGLYCTVLYCTVLSCTVLPCLVVLCAVLSCPFLQGKIDGEVDKGEIF
jgi:hypothetical protein